MVSTSDSGRRDLRWAARHLDLLVTKPQPLLVPFTAWEALSVSPDWSFRDLSIEADNVLKVRQNTRCLALDDWQI